MPTVANNFQGYKYLVVAFARALFLGLVIKVAYPPVKLSSKQKGLNMPLRVLFSQDVLSTTSTF